ncbi:MAG: hypothetical protein HKO76_05850, partial [Acidimicrobiia bacterium]|nr:hypothetical protein [Acidimicrobiia bacterium]
MATKDHVTTFKGASPLQDPVPVNQAGVQESVSDTADVTRASQLNENVAKTQALAVLTGDSVNAPVGSIADILDRDHANGDARQVRLRDRAGDPTNAANKGFAYSKGGEAYWIDSSGNVTQLTEGGVVRSTALRETGGPTVLPVGAWADGEYLKRSGATAVGDTPAGGGVAAPGVRIEISDGQPVNDITLGATDTKILPEDESSISFDVPVSGLYRVDFSLQVVCPSSNTTGQFKVVFDEAGTPQTVG